MLLSQDESQKRRQIKKMGKLYNDYLISRRFSGSSLQTSPVALNSKIGDVVPINTSRQEVLCDSGEVLVIERSVNGAISITLQNQVKVIGVANRGCSLVVKHLASTEKLGVRFASSAFGPVVHW